MTEGSAPSNDKDVLEFKLRVMKGVHAGAECTCRDGEMLLIGAGDDCDVILTDKDVGDRHCVLSFSPGGITVRPIAGAVEIDGIAVERGQSRSLPDLQPIRLGRAIVVAGPDDHPGWQQLPSDPPEADERATPSPGWLRRSHLALAAAALMGVGLTVTIAMSASSQQSAASQPARQQALAEMLAVLGLREARIERSGPEGLRMVGVVPNADILETATVRAHRLDPNITINVRVGDDIAKDVREALRLQKIRAEARYAGDGEVVIRGEFPDLDAIRSAVDSPVVLDIPGLRRVVPQNLAQPIQVEEADPSPFHLVSVVVGDDPHVIGPNRSVYYIGAELPSLGKLVDLDGQVVYVDTGHSIRAVNADAMRSQPAPGNGSTP